MEKALLEIENLHVKLKESGEEIIKGLNLKVEKGEVHALMGPNGSGKSTLANVIMGHPGYKISSGKIFYNGEDITELKSNERAKKGLFLSFQYPQEISGVSIFNFLRTAFNTLRDEKDKKLLHLNLGSLLVSIFYWAMRKR